MYYTAFAMSLINNSFKHLASQKYVCLQHYFNLSCKSLVKSDLWIYHGWWAAEKGNNLIVAHLWLIQLALLWVIRLAHLVWYYQLAAK